MTEQRMHILIIDDDVQVRHSLRDCITTRFADLQQITPNIIDAENGFEGMIKYKNQDFDLVITDLNMPKKGGMAFIGEVYLSDKLDLNKVIVLSGSVHKKELDQFIIMGVQNVLVKPLSLIRLNECIDKFLMVRKNEISKKK